MPVTTDDTVVGTNDKGEQYLANGLIVTQDGQSIVGRWDPTRNTARIDDDDIEDDEPEEYAEDEEPTLPDLDDDDAWEQLQEELQRDWDERTGARGLNELLRFARPHGYDYDKKMTQYTQQFQERMDRLANDLRSGKLKPAQWEYQSKVEILRHNVQAYTVGVAKAQGVAPSKVKLTTEQRKAVGQVVQGQYKHFADFGKEVRATLKEGGELTSRVNARAKMYGNAARGTMGMADTAGRGDQRLRWVRHKDDSCETCIGNDGKVKSGTEWQNGGVLPGIGTACYSNCGCELLPV